jgi:hypothetical protein
MKKYLVCALVVLFIAGLVTAAVAAPKPGDYMPNWKPPKSQSNIAHLYFYEKDDNYVVIDGGAWGKMKYNLSGSTFDFVFNGHGVLPNTDYTLIYYPDPWPGSGLICLAQGWSTAGGEIHLADSVETNSDLPIMGDTNLGAKIWLVTSGYVDCTNQVMSGWPSSIAASGWLWEHHLITFDDTDV